jgi:hypothetical protein
MPDCNGWRPRPHARPSCSVSCGPTVRTRRSLRARWYGSDGGMTMNRHERCLRRLEVRHWRREIAARAVEVGLTAEELLEEAEAFFALSLEDQLAKVDEIAAALQTEGMTMDDVDDLKAMLTREYRP